MMTFSLIVITLSAFFCSLRKSTTNQFDHDSLLDVSRLMSFRRPHTTFIDSNCLNSLRVPSLFILFGVALFLAMWYWLVLFEKPWADPFLFYVSVYCKVLLEHLGKNSFWVSQAPLVCKFQATAALSWTTGKMHYMCRVLWANLSGVHLGMYGSSVSRMPPFHFVCKTHTFFFVSAHFCPIFLMIVLLSYSRSHGTFWIMIWTLLLCCQLKWLVLLKPSRQITTLRMFFEKCIFCSRFTCWPRTRYGPNCLGKYWQSCIGHNILNTTCSLDKGTPNAPTAISKLELKDTLAILLPIFAVPTRQSRFL